MKNHAGALTLEIMYGDRALSMSLFETETQTSTLKHYGQRSFHAADIETISAEITRLLQNRPSEAFTHDVLLEHLKKSARILWDSLLTKQVKDGLSQARSCALILLIDEELVTIPWELLFDGKDFLCLKFAIG